jgi:hypothetical protein
MRGHRIKTLNLNDSGDFTLYGHRGHFDTTIHKGFVVTDYDYVIRSWGQGSKDFRLGDIITREEYEKRERLSQASVFYIKDNTPNKVVLDNFKKIDKTCFVGARISKVMILMMYHFGDVQ